MSSKHFYFFDDKADIGSLDYIERKYNSERANSVVIRKVSRAVLPSELSGFSAYTLDDFHVNMGIGQMSLNGAFREFYMTADSENYSVGKIGSFLRRAENNEKYALEIRHKIFDMILLCGIDRVGVTALYQTGDEDFLDLKNYRVENKQIWDININDLTELEDETILLINKNRLFGV
ncbi:MAG: hypothetical protein K2K57_13645 [Oscillospiraceae bacterium]|nr:hypothetical protein [Oscillospiraceae bacterium]